MRHNDIHTGSLFGHGNIRQKETDMFRGHSCNACHYRTKEILTSPRVRLSHLRTKRDSHVSSDYDITRHKAKEIYTFR